MLCLLILPFLLPFALVSGPEALAADPFAERDVEPEPPWIFFPEPDEATAREIGKVVEAFGDLDRAVVARDLLVRRFGVWSAPELVRLIVAQANLPRTWNAALTTYALRDELGNARELWVLVQPNVRLLEEGADPYRRAFGALALGSFHGPEFAPEPPEHRDRLIRRPPEIAYREHLVRAVDALGRHIADPNPQVRVAVALALGKSGTPRARELLRASERLDPDADDADKSVEGRQAVLLAMGFLPGQADEDIFKANLASEDRKMRRAAALAIAVQALHDHPPDWMREPREILRALKTRAKLDLEDGAEAVFARGVLAARGVVGPDEWDALYTLATSPSTKQITVRGAVQALLFCPEPWFLRKILQRTREGVDLDPTAAAAFLLLLGERRTREGLEICRDYLSNKGRRPKGKPDWDVRYFAAVGLVRALASGGITERDLRHRILDALEVGVKRGMQAGPFRDALKRLLDREGARLRQDDHYSIPAVRVWQLEQSFRDPHGLLARDLRDVAVVRLNDMVPLVLSVQDLKPGVPGNRPTVGIPQRYFEACHAHYPYFTRLDLKADRGKRPRPEMPPADDPREEVRR